MILAFAQNQQPLVNIPKPAEINFPKPAQKSAQAKIHKPNPITSTRTGINAITPVSIISAVLREIIVNDRVQLVNDFLKRYVIQLRSRH